MGMASAKPKLAEKRRKGGGLASAKPKLTEKRRKEASAKQRISDNGE